MYCNLEVMLGCRFTHGDRVHLTGVEKMEIFLVVWNLTADLVKSWVETINCGPAP
jgi:hypothetical protein